MAPTSSKRGATWEVIITLAWIILPLSALVFIALFGRLPAFRKTPIGFAHRLLLIHIPNFLISLDTQLTNRRLTNSTTRLYHYLTEERHPVIMVLFILLQAGGEIMFIPPALPYLPTWHILIVIPVLVFLPYYNLYNSYATSAHHITASSYQTALTAYPYDHTIYHPHQTCRTCHRPKPARSKHCSICKTCISRQDHHCIWINNCVGQHNYRYFFNLLITISLLLLYGMLQGWRILNNLAQARFIPRELTRGSVTTKRWSTRLTWSAYFDAWSIMIAENVGIGSITLLATMCLPLSVAFAIYHVYLFYLGATTNETAKWEDLKEDITDEMVWEGNITELMDEYPGPLDPGIVYDADHYRDRDSRRGRVPKWPIKPEKWIIKIRRGQVPMRSKDGKQTVDERWKMVRDIRDVENIYDLGFWRNIKDLLYPGIG